MLSQANISNTPFDQSSPRHREVGDLQWHRHTYIQKDGHGDSMTELADSVKIMEVYAKRGFEFFPLQEIFVVMI